jgi:AraC-like DNA-binding protein
VVKKRLNHIKPYNDFVVFYGYGLSGKQHANHAIKIILANDELVAIHERKQHKASGVMVRPDTAHKVRGCENLTISAYIDPETEIGRGVSVLFKKGPIVTLTADTAADLFNLFTRVIENHWSETEIQKILLHCFFNSASPPASHVLDKRIEQVIRQIKASSGQHIHFDRLLELCGLSESRLIHLFKKEVGIPIRKYILWQKTNHAIRSISSGATIKHSAGQAGFTDAAHFNRTFVSMFGIVPSSLLK